MFTLSAYDTSIRSVVLMNKRNMIKIFPWKFKKINLKRKKERKIVFYFSITDYPVLYVGIILSPCFAFQRLTHKIIQFLPLTLLAYKKKNKKRKTNIELILPTRSDFSSPDTLSFVRIMIYLLPPQNLDQPPSPHLTHLRLMICPHLYLPTKVWINFIIVIACVRLFP